MEAKVSEGVGETWAAVWPCLTPLLPGWYVATGGPRAQQFVVV